VTFVILSNVPNHVTILSVGVIDEYVNPTKPGIMLTSAPGHICERLCGSKKLLYMCDAAIIEKSPCKGALWFVPIR